MPTNDFLPFAIGGGANVESQADYLADSLRPIGNQPGVALSAFNNKAIRQANYVTSQLAQFLANTTGTDISDDGVSAKMLAQITSRLRPMSPLFTSLLSGSGTYNLPYYFFTASASATSGATYTNNTVTFTVLATIAAGVILTASGAGAPLANGTLTKTSGTGDAAITFYSVRAPLTLEVQVQGAGGGGAASGSAAAMAGSDGGTGGNSTFGTALLVANGGAGGAWAAGGGAGGTVNLNGVPGIAIHGAAGQSLTQLQTITTVQLGGGNGGASPFGGAGSGSGYNAGTGGSAQANSGSGGGGAGNGAVANSYTGPGGGAGGYVKGYIFGPTGSYAYAVGGGAAPGNAGTGGGDGGSSGSGLVTVLASFQ